MKKVFALLAFFGFLACTVPVLVSCDSAPESPEQKAAREQAQKEREAWQNYYADPVIKGREAVRKLRAINDEHKGAIGIALQKMDARAAANASLAFDDMQKAYEKFSIPNPLPEGVGEALEKARISLRNSAIVGTEAFLELQRLAEGGGGSLNLANKKMAECTRLREQGTGMLAEVQTKLQAMPAPEQPKQ